MTVVTIATSPPKHTDAGSLAPEIVVAIVAYSALFLAISGVWELIVRYRRSRQ